MKKLEVVQTTTNSVYQGNEEWARKAIIKKDGKFYIGWQIEHNREHGIEVSSLETEGEAMSLSEAQDLMVEYS
ncbi:MAG: hypothetical protein ACRCZB_04885 [Bacteroidales bacterium]